MGQLTPNCLLRCNNLAGFPGNLSLGAGRTLLRHSPRAEDAVAQAYARTDILEPGGRLALILGELHATAHRTPTYLLGEGTVGQMGHGTEYLPSSRSRRPLAVT